jgi:hypothetical protein
MGEIIELPKMAVNNHLFSSSILLIVWSGDSDLVAFALGVYEWACSLEIKFIFNGF